MAEVEIGVGKTARLGYALGDVTIVPSRRTRDPDEVELSWQLDAFGFALPFMSSAMDSVTSPASAIAIGSLGGLGVLDLEGLWTRYEDPAPLLEEIASLGSAGPGSAGSGSAGPGSGSGSAGPGSAGPSPSHGHGHGHGQGQGIERLRELYRAPVREDLLAERLGEIAAAGTVVCGALRPHHARRLAPVAIEAGLEILVIQSLVVSAEHVAKTGEPLDLKRFVRELDIPVVVGGCSSYNSALHLMRTGAVGVLVGAGAGSTSANSDVLGVGAPQATAIADAAGARTRHLEETGVYVQVVADGGMATGGDIARAIACGADAGMLGAPLAAASEAPGRGWHFAAGVGHSSLPRASLRPVVERGTLEEILLGPACSSDGRTNLFGGLRRAMAVSGCASVKELQKAEVVVCRPAAASLGRA